MKEDNEFSCKYVEFEIIVAPGIGALQKEIGNVEERSGLAARMPV